MGAPGFHSHCRGVWAYDCAYHGKCRCSYASDAPPNPEGNPEAHLRSRYFIPIYPLTLCAPSIGQLRLSAQDGEVRKQFERSLKKQGFSFKLNTKVCFCPGQHPDAAIALACNDEWDARSCSSEASCILCCGHRLESHAGLCGSCRLQVQPGRVMLSN